MNKYLNHILKKIPHQPGIYKMKNTDDVIIYIGKAKDLKKRVSSYFKKTNTHSVKTEKMVAQITDIDYTVTQTELEALLLETNLIKEYRPKYNILMKDDKNYAYVKITTNEDYPRIFVVRQVEKDKAKYFGPKTAASKYHSTLKILRKIFPYRSCNLLIEDHGPLEDDNIYGYKRKVKVTRAGIKYPCLYYHIKRCQGPCIGKPDITEYRSMIDQIIDFLGGKESSILEKLREEMQKAAVNKQFEKAAKTRDKLQSLENIYQNQLITSPDRKHMDVISFYEQDLNVYFNVFQIREGKLIDQQNLTIKKGFPEVKPENFLAAFLYQFYSLSTDIPPEILLPIIPEDCEDLTEVITRLTDHKVNFKYPQKGKNDKLLDLSLSNAISYSKQAQAKWEGGKSKDREEALKKLQTILNLKKTPQRLECYDISHLSGTNTVSSMVVFERGFPKKSHYRHFKLSQQSPGKPNDFASMNETLLRRLKYIKPTIDNPDYKLIQKDIGLLFKLNKNIIQKIKIVSENKEKIILQIPNMDLELVDILVDKILQKFKQNRIYITISPKFKSKLESKGFLETNNNQQKIKLKKTEKIFIFEKLKHYNDPSFSQKPNVIVIDGGKGQLSFAIKALENFQIKIPIISLAKKNEEIYLPGEKKPLFLPKEDPLILMLQHLRDESHRFAIEYNRKLRKKDYSESDLQQITGIGKILSIKLLKKFKSIENIKNSSLEDLSTVIGEKKAIIIKQNLK